MAPQFGPSLHQTGQSSQSGQFGHSQQLEQGQQLGQGQQLNRGQQLSQGQQPIQSHQSGHGQQSPANAPYTFLITGTLASGTRTIVVSQSAIDLMEAQISRWNTKTKGQAWSVKSFVSHRRCVDTRRLNLSTAKNPPTSDNPNVACRRCIKHNLLCVLIGEDGPVVVPLPVAARSVGATPTNGAYFVKEKE